MLKPFGFSVRLYAGSLSLEVRTEMVFVNCQHAYCHAAYQRGPEVVLQKVVVLGLHAQIGDETTGQFFGFESCEQL